MQSEKIEKVAIVGAGAMGAAYASMFSDAGSFSPYFLAEGARYRRLKNAGFQVNGKRYEIPVMQPQDVAEPADLVLVALKHHHLEDALGAIAAVTGPETIILSVMNGLDSEDIIGAAVGRGSLVQAIAVGIDAVREENRFFYAQPGRIIFGQRGGADDSRCMDRLGEALTRAGIPHETPADMERIMWWKFMINVGINQASAVLRSPYGLFQKSADARVLLQLLMQEVVELAGRNSVDLTGKDLHEWFQALGSLPPGGKTSMLQDIEAGRKTEVEIFAGRVVSMGLALGQPTPVNRAILHIIKAMEQQGLGALEPGG